MNKTLGWWAIPFSFAGFAVSIETAQAADPACDLANDATYVDPFTNYLDSFSPPYSTRLTTAGNLYVTRTQVAPQKGGGVEVTSTNCAVSVTVGFNRYVRATAKGDVSIRATFINDSFSGSRTPSGGSVGVPAGIIGATSTAGNVSIEAGQISTGSSIISVVAGGRADVRLGVVSASYGLSIDGDAGVSLIADSIKTGGGVFLDRGLAALTLSSGHGGVSFSLASLSGAEGIFISAPRGAVTLDLGSFTLDPGIPFTSDEFKATYNGDAVAINAGGPVHVSLAHSLATVTYVTYNGIVVRTSSTADFTFGSDAVVTTKGTGLIVSAAGGALINNAGVLPSIDARGSGAVTITNAGRITNVLLGGGDDSINVLAGGLLQGSFDSGAGTDQLTLAGTGRFSSLGGLETLRVGAGGRLGIDAPAPAVLTTPAAITFDSGATLEIRATPVAIDRIASTGAIFLNGGTVAVSASGTLARVTRATIVTGATVTGRFSGAAATGALDAQLAYSAGAVTLTLLRTDLTYAQFAATPNQRAAAAAIDAAGLGAQPFEVLGALDPTAIGDALPDLTGEDYASALTFAFEADQRIPRLLAGRLRAAAPAAPAVWIAAVGSDAKWSGDGVLAGAEARSSGLALGGEGQFGSVRLGLAGFYGAERIEGGAAGDLSTIDAYALSAYGGYRVGPFGLQVGASWLKRNVEAARPIVFATVQGVAAARYSMTGYQLFGDASWRFGGETAGASPFASLTYEAIDRAGFTESSGPAPLVAAATSREVLLVSLGLRADYRQAMDDGTAFELAGSAAWRGASGDLVATDMLRFAGGGPAFAVSGIPLAADGFELGATTTLNFPAGHLELAYAGLFADRMSMHSFRLVGVLAF